MRQCLSGAAQQAGSGEVALGAQKSFGHAGLAESEKRRALYCKSVAVKKHRVVAWRCEGQLLIFYDRDRAS